MTSPIISPSLLAADFGHLAREIEMLNNSEAEWVHFDVMDGVFVPNISFGIPVLEAVRKLTTKKLDVHLMIEKPHNYIELFKQAGADILTIHMEGRRHLHRNLLAIKDAGMKAGVALNPHTPIHILNDIIHEIDMVLIMTVNPGFGGQAFIEHSYKKIKDLKQLITETNSDCLIQVDGGVTHDNAKKLVEAGVDCLVAGSTVFKAENQIESVAKLKHCV